MREILARWIVFIVLSLGSGCSAPVYVDRGKGETGYGVGQDVEYQVFEAYRTNPPDCVALLPFVAKSPQEGERLRQSLYAHLSIQSRKNVPLEKVDHMLKTAGGNRVLLAEKLQCGALIEGQVTEYGSLFLGVYSRVAVGLEVKMTRAKDQQTLWTGKHVAVSYGGSLPLDLVGIGLAVADATGNVVSDEQPLRLIDDLTRRLVSTIPDSKITPLADPEPQSQTADDHDGLVQARDLFAQGEGEAALAKLASYLTEHPDHAEALYLKSRILLDNRDYGGAETAILKALSYGGKRSDFCNVLGVISVSQGRLDRAHAAYQMAIDSDKQDGFGWYNLAVLDYNAHQLPLAAEHFYGASLAYIKTQDFAKAERALNDLKDLENQGVSVETKIKFIQDSFDDLKARKS